MEYIDSWSLTTIFLLLSIDTVKANCSMILQYLYIQLQELSRRIIHLHAFKLCIISYKLGMCWRDSAWIMRSLNTEVKWTKLSWELKWCIFWLWFVKVQLLVDLTERKKTSGKILRTHLLIVAIWCINLSIQDYPVWTHLICLSKQCIIFTPKHAFDHISCKCH